MDLKFPSYLHPMNIKMYVSKQNYLSQQYVYVCVSQVSDMVTTSPKQHGISIEGSQPPCSFKMTKILSIRWCQDTFFFHIMQYEMNVTNRFTTNQRGLASRRDQKREVKQGGAVTCGNTNLDLMTTHLSKVFAQLIAVWFSTDMHLHTNAVVTNLSICPFSHGRKQHEYHRNVEGYCYGSCKSFNNKPFQLLPNTQTLVDLLQGHFTISQCRINVRAAGAALTPKEVNI